MKVKHTHAKYIKGTSTVSILQYANDRSAIQLNDPNGFPMAKASVNLPDEPCPEGHCYLKTYSENEGIAEDLIAGGIVTPPISFSVNGLPLVRIITEDPTKN
jgi:hypothetical protein